MVAEGIPNRLPWTSGFPSQMSAVTESGPTWLDCGKGRTHLFAAIEKQSLSAIQEADLCQLEK